MIRVGVIGCGFMGGMHTACYKALENEGVKITAVADVRPDFGKALADKYSADLYSTGMELIEKADVDVVDICLPTDLHVAHAVAAMKKGRNVFVEKPVAFKDADLELIAQIEKETGAKVQVGQVIRFWNEYVWLKQTVDSGKYGRVVCGAFRRLSSRPEWASEGWLHDPDRSGGLAVDMHVHDVDFVRYLMGEPDRVQAQAYRDADGLIQQIYTLYGYGKDVGISIEAGWDYPADFPFNAGFRVKMEKATVVLDAGVLTVYPQGGAPFNPELQEDFSGENDIGGNISSLGGYYNEIKFFIEGIQGKHALDVATVTEAINSVKLVKKEIEVAGGLINK